jgi:hypothetical protein
VVSTADASTRPPAPTPLPAPVWTTPAKSNVCTEYLREPIYSLTFPTREGCQNWVQARSCQPGFTCFDGCNWRQCNYSGDGMSSTLLACSVALVPDVPFQPGTTKPSAQLDWAWVITQLKSALRPRERHMFVVGFAEPSEGANAAAVARLAEQRAKAITKQLVHHGLDAKRITTKVGDAEAYRRNYVAAALQRVRFEFDPGERVRDDFEPSSREYQEFCGVKPRRGE